MPAEDPLYDTKGAAAYLGISASTLERYRLTGIPFIEHFKYHGLRGPVRYRKSVLDSFLAGVARGSTSHRREK